ncbi:MAG: hypothetical protein IOC67_08430 [Methylobacterium sp.]|nr:hypothetical protein [Methylobacterium sp.]
MMNARALPIIEFTLDAPSRKIEAKQRSLEAFLERRNNGKPPRALPIPIGSGQA